MNSQRAKTYAFVGASYAGAGNTAPALYPIMIERKGTLKAPVRRELFIARHIRIIAD